MSTNETRPLAAYMKARADFEQVEWCLTEEWLQDHFDAGIRVFFGVTVDDDGELLSDTEQPTFFGPYMERSQS